MVRVAACLCRLSVANAYSLQNVTRSEIGKRTKTTQRMCCHSQCPPSWSDKVKHCGQPGVCDPTESRFAIHDSEHFPKESYTFSCIQNTRQNSITTASISQRAESKHHNVWPRSADYIGYTPPSDRLMLAVRFRCLRGVDGAKQSRKLDASIGSRPALLIKPWSWSTSNVA